MIIIDETTGIIYCISFPNGKKYIGQTKRNFEQRMKEHLRDDSGCTKLKNALNKYPEDQVHAMILRKNVPVCDLDYWENFFVDVFDSIENGYNIKRNDNPRIPEDVIIPDVNITPRPKKVNPFERFTNSYFIPEKVNKLITKPVVKKNDEPPHLRKFPVINSKNNKR